MSQSKKQSGFALPIVIILVVVGLVGLGAVGYYSYKTLQEQKELTKDVKITRSEELTPSPILSPTPTEPPEETADWKTYTNTKYNYSFKYPPECSLGPLAPGCKTAIPRPPECLCFLNGENPDWVLLQGDIRNKGWANFDVTVRNNLPPETKIVSWLRQEYKDFSWYEDIPDEPDTEIDGIPAVKIYQLGSNSDKPEEMFYQIWATDEIYFIKGNKLFIIQMLDVDSQGGKTFYNSILPTFKFID